MPQTCCVTSAIRARQECWETFEGIGTGSLSSTSSCSPSSSASTPLAAVLSRTPRGPNPIILMAIIGCPEFATDGISTGGDVEWQETPTLLKVFVPEKGQKKRKITGRLAWCSRLMKKNRLSQFLIR